MAVDFGQPLDESINIEDNETIIIPDEVVAPLGEPAITITGENGTLIVTDTGSISADDEGNTAVQSLGEEALIANLGDISGDFNGISSTGDELVLVNTGTIASNSRAVDLADGDDLLVFNAGDIIGTDDQRNGTLYVNGNVDEANIVNFGTGVIDAGEGNVGDGISVQVGIASEDALSEDIEINNFGRISGRGEPEFGPEGRLTANGSSGVRFFNGSGEAEATVTGVVNNLGLIESEANVGFLGGFVVEDGVAFEGSILNGDSGTIQGVQNGLYIGNAEHDLDIVNSGVITSDSRAVNLDGDNVSLTNSGDILGTGDQRNGTVYIDGTGDDITINNLNGGVIDAGEHNSGSGVSVQVGATGDDQNENINIINDGVIQGRGTDNVPAGVRLFVGSGLEEATFVGDITNQSNGLIASEEAAGILIEEGVIFDGTITNDGTISGGNGVAIDAAGALGDLDVINSGELEGDVLLGQGNDTFVQNSDEVVSRIDGGEGIDTIDLSGQSAGIVIDLDLNTPTPGPATQDGAILDAPGGEILTEIDDFENVIGTDFDDLILGNNEINILEGGAGNDSIHSFAGADILDGGTGIDTALFTAGSGVVVDLDEDGNAISSFGDQLISFENINGSATGDDTISGNSGINVLNGQGGNDILNGEGGADTLLGGAGDDIIISDGLDTIDGGEGTDTVDFSAVEANIANGGNPVFDGVIIDLDVNSAGAAGTPGQDGGLLNAPPGSVAVAGVVPEANILQEVDDVENVIGSEFNDGLFGNNEVNVLQGEAGNDVIHGFAGDDFLAGGVGTDTVIFAAAPAGVEVDLNAQVSAEEFSSIVADESPAIFAATGGAGNNVLSGFENVTGSQNDDIITGDANDNVLNGNDGNDILNGAGGADTLLGGLGDDIIISDGLDTIDGGEGTDTVDFSAVEANIANGGNPVFDGVIIDLDVNSAGAAGTPGQDGGLLNAPPGSVAVAGVVPEANILQEVDDVENVIGSEFNDGLFGNNEVNVLQGEAGNDVIHGFAGDDFLAGGVGTDTVIFAAAPAGVEVDLNAQVSAEEFSSIVADESPAIFAATGGAGNNVLSGFENVTGSQNDDIITGDANDNVLNGNDGNDILNGAGGADTLLGGLGDDILISDGLDTVDGGEGTDTIDLSGLAEGVVIDLDLNTPTPGPATQDGAILDAPGGEVVVEVDDVENVIGTDFDDLILGNNEINILEGGAGNDSIHSFAGADILDGGTGIDTALFTAGSGVVVDLDEDGNAISSFGDQLISFENINGSAAGDDIISGNSGANVLNGQGGNDILNGEGGVDTLLGGDGNDVLVGGAGVLDFLTGGAGFDTFDFTVDTGADTGFSLDIVTDFLFTDDLLDVSAFFSDVDVALGSASQIGSATLLSFGEGNFAALLDTNADDLSADNFIVAEPIV